ncbi:3212_t:CDS:1, partial [Funneliformis caledonium]
MPAKIHQPETLKEYGQGREKRKRGAYHFWRRKDFCTNEMWQKWK